MGKIKFESSIDEYILEEFERLAFNEFGPQPDYRDEAITEAFQDWIDKKKV